MSTTTEAKRIRPVTDDHDTGGFWEAARRGELVVRRCDRCAAILHVPVAYCHQCDSWETSWVPVRGAGRLVSWTTAEHEVHPAYPVPYTVVLVELVDHPGVRFVGYLAGAPQLTDGQAMAVRFEGLDDDVVLPQWEPV
jgi:uncharacterized OB-fold protein